MMQLFYWHRVENGKAAIMRGTSQSQPGSDMLRFRLRDFPPLLASVNAQGRKAPSIIFQELQNMQQDN